MEAPKNKLSAWISAMRLRTLPLALSCIFMGGFCALQFNQFNWPTFLLAGLTTLFLQILSNLANDYGDSVKGTDNENRIGPVRAVQSGLISSKQMRNAVIVFVVLSLISGITLIITSKPAAKLNESLPYVFSFLALGLLSIAAAIRYTVGTKAYGYKGWGDLFVFLFFGLVGVCGSFYLFADSFSLAILLPAASVGFLSAGVLNLNNMRDIENDAASGKHTLPVQMGLKNAKLYHYFLVFAPLPLMCAYILIYFPALTLLSMVGPGLVLSYHLMKVARVNTHKEFIPLLPQLAMSTLLMVLCFGLGVWLSQG